MEKSPAPAAQRARAPRRERASAQREHILDAAASVFTERGYERATTKAIAAAAELSEGRSITTLQASASCCSASCRG
jgi:hypothetical protein